MKKRVFTAVIGGGAAGMVCAVAAAEKHREKKILLIESADRVGKKLLVTGNGRCNLSNRCAHGENYHGEGAEEFVNILFEKYNPAYVIEWFHRLGLLTRAEPDGRVYPLSNQASSVLGVLLLALRRYGIEVMTSCSISGVRRTGDGYVLFCGEDTVIAEKLVVACGGRADYAGRIGASADILRMLSLDTTALSPALSPVRVRSHVIGMLKGVRADAQVTLIKGGTELRQERGEVQFADRALSGICVFNLSRTANLEHGCSIVLSLLPDLSDDQIVELLSAHAVSADSCADLFTGIFHKAIGLALLKECVIPPSQRASDLSANDIRRLCRLINRWEFECETRRDFQNAQVTAGGVRLVVIDPMTCEHRRHRGMYIIGEALDVDGDCGGYNLQFAFASGLCAGDAL